MYKNGVTNALFENIKIRKQINNICVDLNKKCFDVGLEYNMGHIIPIIPNITNKIYENEYFVLS